MRLARDGDNRSYALHNIGALVNLYMLKNLIQICSDREKDTAKYVQEFVTWLANYDRQTTTRGTFEITVVWNCLIVS